MPYPRLYKLFHQNELIWKKTYQSLFEAPTTKHLDIAIHPYRSTHNYSCFYCYNEDIALLMSQIHKETQCLLQKKQLPGIAIQQFARLCMIEEIKSSNDIEGVHSTHKEIREAMDKQYNPQYSKNTRLWCIVNKYNKLLQHEEIPFVTCSDIRTFYDDFLLEEIIREDPNNVPDGTIFRAQPVEVTSGTKTLHQGIIPEANIIDHMEKALRLLHDETIPDLIRLSLFHYLLGYIHPFYDGNGRLSRFITSYYLSGTIDTLAAIRLSITIKKKKSAYYRIFENTNTTGNHGDLTPFIIGFLELILLTIKDTSKILNEKNNLLMQYKKKLDAMKINNKTEYAIYLVLLQATLFSDSGATYKEIATTIHKTPRTVITYMSKIPKKYIETSKSQHSNRFKLNINQLGIST